MPAIIQAHIDIKDTVGTLVRTKTQGSAYYEYYEFPKGNTLRIAHYSLGYSKVNVDYELNFRHKGVRGFSRFALKCP